MNKPVGEIHAIALRQLAQKEAIANDWPVVGATHEDRFARCYDCGLAIYAERDQFGVHYQMTFDQKLALTVAHISIHHREAFNGID